MQPYKHLECWTQIVVVLVLEPLFSNYAQISADSLAILVLQLEPLLSYDAYTSANSAFLLLVHRFEWRGW